jgi:hypothetical protein
MTKVCKEILDSSQHSSSRLDRYVPAAMNTHATTQLLEGVFSMWSACFSCTLWAVNGKQVMPQFAWKSVCMWEVLGFPWFSLVLKQMLSWYSRSTFHSALPAITLKFHSNADLQMSLNQTPWPESASELYRPPFVSEVSANFCR